MKKENKTIITAASIALFCSCLALPVLSDNGDKNPRRELTQDQDMKHVPVSSKSKYDKSESSLRNAWLEGKLETALLINRHLNNFTINSEVNNGKAILTGSVESDIDKDLAEQVALSIEGITDVDNQLKIDGEKSRSDEKKNGSEQSFSQKIEDMTTTAAVKSKLLANQNTHGIAINVDTLNSVVVLTGDVKTSEEKQLAEKIAENTDGVKSVKNMLNVTPNS